MSKSGDKFIQHRDEEQQREAQELARREAHYLINRKQPSQRDIKPKQDAHHTEERTKR